MHRASWLFGDSQGSFHSAGGDNFSGRAFLPPSGCFSDGGRTRPNHHLRPFSSISGLSVSSSQENMFCTSRMACQGRGGPSSASHASSFLHYHEAGRGVVERRHDFGRRSSPQCRKVEERTFFTSRIFFSVQYQQDCHHEVLLLFSSFVYNAAVVVLSFWR